MYSLKFEHLIILFIIIILFPVKKKEKLSNQKIFESNKPSILTKTNELAKYLLL